ncbi:MAG: hypothetical protein J6C85_02605 [Alphaproteobacteria bacterium]|nr:hypothetical protein [Alphaproteobacteria bacterium]
MDTFEIYCKTTQCFDEIEKLCFMRGFALAKKKSGDENLMAKAVMKCRELRKKVQALRCESSLKRKQCKLFLGETDGQMVDQMLQQLDFSLKKEREDKEYFNTLFKEAYRPGVRYPYENDYPEDEPRAKFLLWESGVNPYRDLQNIKKNKISEVSLDLFEICDLFCDFRRILREDNTNEGMSEKIKTVFAAYRISLD